MSFEEITRSLQQKLRHVGYTKIRDEVPLGTIDNADKIIHCDVIAKKAEYKIIYMETESNWRGMSSAVANAQTNPCLIITRYDDLRMVMATVKDYGTLSKKPRYLVIETGKSLDEFIKSIKVPIEDNAIDIDDKIQATFDKLTTYKQAMDKFADDLDYIIQETKMLVDKKAKNNTKYERQASQFLDTCKKIINENMTMDDIRDMVIQHILTYKIFSLVYGEQHFNTTNTVAKSLEKLKRSLNVSSDHVNYRTMELIAESLTDDDQRQEFLKMVYETFYNKYDPGLANKDGIVYTPEEVVSFIVKSTDILLQKHFGRSFASDNVTVLDPFTGTGTFPVHVMRQMNPKDLERKYQDIHASEISVLPYYIAALNIEHTYQKITGKYKEFENLCWMDTFEKGSDGHETMGKFLEIDKNVERITKQQQLKIHVIIGNPPYSVGQSNYNDQNPNTAYAELDDRIKQTYLQKTKSHAKNSLYDSYVRSIRWASDRIGNSGIIAFITNASFLRSETAAGIRACLAEEFNEIWCFDLRGNQRTQGEISRKEGGKIFGSGSRAPVAITILVKNPQMIGMSERETPGHTCIIRYKDIGDYISREEKLEKIKISKSIQGIKDWQIIKPDVHHDWLDQRTSDFSKYTPIGIKKQKNAHQTIFMKHWIGIATSRDVWAYNSSKNIVGKNMQQHISYCNNQNPDHPVLNSKQVKWSHGLSERLKKSPKQKFDVNKIRISIYRPFFKQWLYFDKIFIHRPAIAYHTFPDVDSENLVICVPYKFTGDFSTFITNITPDLEVIHHGQYFPLYTYEHNNKKRVNITDYALTEYQTHYNDKKITKTSIFYYVYGLLHHPTYRTKFANNLSRELPHIPMAPDFWTFSKTGKKLATLHLNFETCKRYNLGTPKVQIQKIL